jgi:hypothetical protein
VCRGQNRVRVMKDQHIAGRVFRREIHLRATVGLRRTQVNDAGGPCRFRRGGRGEGSRLSRAALLA